MRFPSNLVFAFMLGLLALGPVACTSSSWCADCEQSTSILGLNYRPADTYTVGTAIPVNPPRPAGGTPRIYTVEAGTLPPGLSLDPATGLITGTPTASGVYSLTIRGTNSANSATQTIQITVVPSQPLALSYATPQVFPAGTPIALQVPTLAQATPGLGTTYALTSGSLPAGLVLQADGSIAGTPSTPGVFPFTVTATNGTRTAAAPASYTVTPAGSLGLNYVTPQTFTAGAAITTQSPTLVNPTPGVATTYATTGGSLPVGLLLNADGTITGAPTAPGVYAFTVTATNGTRVASSTLTYTVTYAAALSLSYATPRTFAAESAIAAQVATLADATPGLATTFALTAGTLPAGLALNADGSITGTPTTPGVFGFTVMAANGARTATASASYTVVPTGALTLDYTSPQTFVVGAAIATQLPTVTNPTPGVPTTFAVTSGSLPVGLSLMPDGTITGTPTTVGVSPFTVTATNGARTATSSPTYTVVPQVPQGSYQSVTTTVGVPLTLTPQNLGGGITAATLASGSLPAGMTLNADGTISGTPTTSGVYPFTVQLCNGSSCMVTATATVTVNDLGVLPMGASYANGSGTVGTPLSVLPSVSSGGPVTSATLQSGSVPPGMTLNPDGSLTGTPTSAGSFTALVTLANGSGGRVTVPLTVIVSNMGSAALVAAYPESEGQVGTPLSVAPALTSGGPVTTAALAGGVLPPGMTLNANGTISGTPTQAGSFIALVQLCNASGGCTIQSVRIDVNAAGTPLVGTYSNAIGAVGAPLTVAPAIGSGGPVTGATLLSGSVPPGMTLNPDGTITGTPTQPGTYTLNLRLCNGAGGCETLPLTLTVNPGAPAASYSDTTTTFGTPATKAPVNAGGPITSASISAGGGAGLTVAGDGTLSVAATTPVGTYNLSIHLCNAVNACVDVPAKVTVNPVAPVVAPLMVTETYGTASTLTPPNTGGAITSATITTGGPIATGLTLNANGTITQSGTTPVGVYGPYTVNYCNATNCSSSTVTITVNPASNLVVSYATPQTFPMGSAIAAQSPTLSNANPGLATTYAITSGSLPTGLTLNADGTITGTPNAAGVFTFAITATNGTRTPAVSNTVTYTVNPAANLTVSYATPQTFPVGSAIASQGPTLSNANPGLATTYAITSGSLPTGLTLNADGTITGTPNAAGVFTFAITATNGTRTPAVSNTVTYTVNPAANLTVSYATPQTFPVGSAIASQGPTLGNANPGLTTTYAVTSGNLPTGLTLNGDGTITGTPTVANVYTFTITATNGTRTPTVSNAVTYTVNPASNLVVSYATPQTFPVGSAIAAQSPTLGNANPGLTTTYAVTSGSLPSGLTLNGDGTITGTPTVANVYTFTITATNGTRTPAVSNTVTYTVNPASNLTVSYATPQTFPVGSAIASQGPTLGNANPGLTTTYAVTSGSLPSGLTLNADGTITGTPTVANVYTFTITATNGTRTPAVSNTVTYTVNPASNLTVSYATPQTFPVGSAIASQGPTLGNANPGLTTTYAVTSGSLPTGLTLNGDGTITGTPNAAGVFTFAITATNGTRTPAVSSAVTYTVNPASNLTVSYATPQTFPVGSAIASQGPTLSNANPGLATTYAITSGSLPTGLILNADGTITGTPNAAGVFTFAITATNGTRTPAVSSAVTYTVNPASNLVVSYATPQTFPVGSAIASQGPTLGNANPGLTTTYAVTSGSLPSGLTLNADGTITGTPTVANVYTFTITATNGTRTPAVSNTVTYTVNPASNLTVSYATPQTFPVGSAIASQGPTLGNANPGLTTTYAVTSGSLPTGLTLNGDGTITGTPNAAGVFTFAITATNGTRTPAVSSAVTYTVNPASNLTVSYATPQTFPVGSAIASQGPTLSNANPGLATTYAITSGSLPTGLILNADGTITGTPNAAGVFTFAITATNGTRTPAVSSAVTYTVNPASNLVVSYATPQTFPVGSAIASQGPTLGNANPGLTTTYAVTSGSLPTGLTLNADGTITGTPNAAGVFTFAITATNGTRTPAVSNAVTYTVNPASNLVVSYATPQTFPMGSAIAAQSPTLTNANPGLTTTYAVTSGSLPSGLTLNGDGTITGTPTVANVYTFTITATNGTRTLAVSNTVTYTVNPASNLTVSYATLQTFPVGSAIASQGPTLGNANPGLTTTYAVTSGSLPTGLTLNADGTITGTPNAAGVFTFAITATNGTRTPAVSNTVTYTVNPASNLTVSYATPQTFPMGSAIAAQSPTLTNANPGLTTTYAVTSGSLPSGLTLNGDGTITGTPTVANVYTFTITATNGTRTPTVSSAVTYTVNPASNLVVSYATPQTFPKGLAIATQSPTLGNANPGLTTTYAVTSGALPGGLTLNANGTITGTPNASGAFTFTITATNGTRTPAVSNSVSYTIAVTAPASLNYTTPVTYTATLPITNNNPNPAGGAPTAYGITSGSLPTGLTLDPVTGVISGTPTVGGSFSATISGTNTAGGASQAISITVLAYPTANLSSNPSVVPAGQSSSLTVLFTGSASGNAVLTGDGIVTPLTLASGSSVPTGIVSTPGTTRSYTLTVTNAQGYTATSNATVQWIAVPSDTWTVTIPTSGGGPLTPGVGNLLNGQIAITVPDQGQSLCGAVTLTVNKEASLPGSIIATARDYSHTFNIASNLGYPFRVPITVTLAYDPTLASPNLAASDLPMAFYWDPSYSRWVSAGLKAVDTTNHTVTFTTLLPGRYAVLGIPSLALATQSLGFASGTDDWRQNNPSVYDLPGGASLGMGSFASWYFPFSKPASGTGLYNLFPTVGDANAAALISRLANGTMDSWSALWTQSAYALTDKQAGLALITGLMVTGQPQLFLMGDARPAVNDAVATAVYAYDNTAAKFSVLDPNYPGNALTITWTAGAGFSSYDRAAGYSPALVKYAFEGQTSVHRLADYDRVLAGADTGFPAATFATINVTNIAEVSSPNLAQDVVVTSPNGVTISGTVTNGDETATYIYWSQNGSAPRIAVPLVGNAFSFTIPALADPYATTVALETTSTPCDPTFSHSGFVKFVVKQSGLTPWFTNSCFENGDVSAAPWTLQQGFNGKLSGVGVNPVPYPSPQTFSTTNGNLNSYPIVWNQAAVDSALVHSPTHAADANVPGIASVLDGNYSFRVNDPASGAHISRMYETITVPTTIADPKLTFYWAGAMQSAGHVPSELPYVDILVQDVTNNYEVLYFVHHYPPSTVSGTTYTDGYPGWIAGTGSGNAQWFGINWQKVSLMLGASRQGHQLKITVMASDCDQGGHGGYAYIDNIGCN